MEDDDMGVREFFDRCNTSVRIYDGSRPSYPEEVIKKQNIYYGCNWRDIPTVTIQWSEKGRGFGEYVFQLIDGKMVCDNECDSRETVKRILCIMVDQCEFVDENLEPAAKEGAL